MCRVISLTEQRGYKQVEILLNNAHVLSDKTLTKIFRIIEQDEPSHWEPMKAGSTRMACGTPNGGSVWSSTSSTPSCCSSSSRSCSCIPG